MIGMYIPFSDGYGIVGYGYLCPECGFHSLFTNCEDGCKKCKCSESYVDPDEWHDAEIAKPKGERAWDKRNAGGAE